MTEDSSRKFAEASLLRATKALESAKLLLEHGELEDSASRAYYYAMFYAAKGILFIKGVKAKTHVGTISQFGECIIKKHLLDEAYADMLRKAFDLRQKSDYEIYIEIDEESVKEAVNNATEFVEKIKQLVETTSS